MKHVLDETDFATTISDSDDAIEVKADLVTAAL